MPVEAEILQTIYQLRTPLADYFFQSITFLGSTVFALIFLLGLYLSGEKKLAKKTFWAGILTSAVTWTMKFGFGRPRPEVEQQIGQQMFNLSFPSGHTSTAFVLATLLSWRKPEVRPYFYILAAVVGFSRIYLGLHYPTDVVAGAVVGYISGKIVLEKETIRSHMQQYFPASL